MNDDINSQRLKDLEEHISRDTGLLKEYEDLLRTEPDPRRRLGYRQNIEKLRESLTSHQQERNELLEKQIVIKLKDILENSGVLFIGEKVSEISDFIISDSFFLYKYRPTQII